MLHIPNSPRRSVLEPGGSFLLVTLGEPRLRLPLLCKEELGWKVSVCLVPRAKEDELVPQDPNAS